MTESADMCTYGETVRATRTLHYDDIPEEIAKSNTCFPASQEHRRSLRR